MLKLVLRHTARSTKHLARFTLKLGILLAIVAASVLLLLRYSILPNIERYHAEIVAASSQAIGRQLLIGRIEADWYGLRPRLLLSDVQVLDEHGRTALAFPSLRNTVAWSTLLLGELRFKTIELDKPELLIRRDAQGRRFIAGVASGAQAGVMTDASTSDWWLRHSNIVVHDGHVVWQDDMLGAPPLVFKHVELRIDNRGERHRFALRATLATKASSRVDLRGDLYGDSFTNLKQWQGNGFLQMERVDTAELGRWFALPKQLKRASGDLRLWVGMQSGAISQIDVDANLQDASVQMADALPQLDLHRISGRIGWKQSAGGVSVSMHGLSLHMQNGFRLKPTDLVIQYSPQQGYRSASGEISANVIELSDINRLLAYFPVPDAVSTRLLALSPQGRVSDLQARWQGDWQHLAQYRVQARFDQVALRQTETLPGFTGLSGEVDGNDSVGRLTLNSRGLKVEAPGFLAEPLAFDEVIGRLDWQRNGRGWDLKLNKAQVSNADLKGTITGAYQINDGPGVADISINLSRASVANAARYIPMHAFNDATYRWLQTGLQQGESDGFQMRVRGDLRDFPFPDSKEGLFRIDAKARDVAIEFDPGWPRIEQAQAELLILGRRLEVKAKQAKTAGASLQNVSVVLPDTLADELVMQVRGQAADSTQRCLDYILKSPVRGYLDGYTDDFHAQGDGVLKLQLDIPLNGNTPAKVVGSFRFANNQVDLGEHIPLLKNANGEITFTNSTVEAPVIQAQILGGPARIALRSENGVLLAEANGTLNADSLSASYRYPLLRGLKGSMNWNTQVRIKDKLADVSVSSDLQGLTSDLPAPFNKTAAEKKTFRFEQKDISKKQNEVSLRYAEIVDAKLTRTFAANGKLNIKRAAITLGKTAGKAGREGIWISGELKRFGLEGWQGWAEFPSGDGVLPNIANIDVTLGTVYGFGSTFNQVNIRGSGRNGLISTRVASRELNGDFIWQPQEQGKLLVRLKNTILGENPQGSEELPSSTAIRKVENKAGVSLPEIDVVIEKLTWKGRQLGRLEMLLGSEEGDAVLQSLRLINPDGLLQASGRWSADTDRTRLDAKLDITDAGKILSRSGYAEALKDGGGTLVSELSWAGGPDAFNYASLDGTLRLKTGKGRFLQVNPGAAKLLGVLSLQSLPKRITLDFTDVISPGFEFSSISGEAHIERGLLKTSDFKMIGAAAKITLNGQVDLEHETQNLKVRVLPTIGDNVSLLSFAAGPAIGVGVLLANKILNDPLDKLVAFDYNVSGSWADPKVERAGRAEIRPEEPLSN